MYGWMDGWMLLLLLPARNKQIFARPRLNRLLQRISGKLKLKVFAPCNIFPLIPQKPLIQLGKEGRRCGGGIRTFQTTMALTLTLPVILTLTLLLAFILAFLSPPSCRPLRAVWEVSQLCTPWRFGWEISVPVLCSDLRMVKSGPPHDMPRPSSSSPAAPCTHSTPPGRASRGCPTLSS
jgi:hypothetical protein